MGFYLSIPGTITYKSASPLHETLRYAPLDRILSETDAPFLTPLPHRGRRNEPAYVSLVSRRSHRLWPSLWKMSQRRSAQTSSISFSTGRPGRETSHHHHRHAAGQLHGASESRAGRREDCSTYARFSEKMSGPSIPIIFANDSFLKEDFIFKGRLKPYAIRGTSGEQVLPDLNPSPPTLYSPRDGSAPSSRPTSIRPFARMGSTRWLSGHQYARLRDTHGTRCRLS